MNDAQISVMIEAHRAEVIALCQKVGFGFVMQQAAQEWARLSPDAAITTGPCRYVLAAVAKTGRPRLPATDVRLMLQSAGIGMAKRKRKRVARD